MMTHRVPLVLQNEISECGLACVAMICGAYGKPVGLPELRLKLDPGTRGSSLKDLALLGESLGFRVKSLKVGLNQVDKLRLPAILHWDIAHYVVLVRIDGDYYEINDPGLGRRRVTRHDLSTSFTGLAQEYALQQSLDATLSKASIKISWLLRGFDSYGPALGAVLAVSVVMQALVLALPFTVQLVADQMANGSGDAEFLIVTALGGVLGLLAFALLLRLRATLVMFVASSLDTSGSQRLIEKMFSLPYDFFARRDASSLLNRFTNLRDLRALLTQGLAESVVEAALSAAALAALWIYMPQGALAGFVTVAAYAGYRWATRNDQRDRLAEMFQTFGAQHGSLIESLHKVETIKANSIEPIRQSFWIARYMQYQDSVVRKLRKDASNQMVSVLLFGIGYLIVGLSAVSLVKSQELAMSEALTCVLLVFVFMTRFSTFLERFFEILIAKVHLDSLADIVTADSERNSGHVDTVTTSQPISIEVRNVSFRYSPSEPFILRNVSFTIEPGACVALTGPSGCGKSTLMAILLGLRSPSEGDIFINGISQRSIDLPAFRRATGTVLQGDKLFYGTVLENVSFFDFETSVPAVRKSLELAHALDVVDRLPMKEHTMLSDTPMLSGGEIQRILLARALHKNPRLLLLDEASSALDESTELCLNNTIAAIGATRLLIAHRTQTIRMTSRVIELGFSGDLGCSTVVRTYAPASNQTKAAHATQIAWKHEHDAIAIPAVDGISTASTAQ